MLSNILNLRGYNQKFPDLPPGARTANDTALCHYVQLYRHFVSQSSEFWRHNLLCCSSRSVYCCCCLFRYRLSPETFGYTLYIYFYIHISHKDTYIKQIMYTTQTKTVTHYMTDLSTVRGDAPRHTKTRSLL
jgi:hypothetical protein